MTLARRLTIAIFGVLRAGAVPVMCLPGHRFGHHCGLRSRDLFHGRFRRLSKRGKRSVDRLDQARQVRGRDRIVADMGRNDIGDMIQQCFVFHAGETLSNPQSGASRRLVAATPRSIAAARRA